jgi:branched-chain amino acid transport system ATP-binding protein
MLEVKEIDSFYGDLWVLRKVSLSVSEGEVVAVFGPNGHGKSTLLKAIAGLHPPLRGSIVFKDREITREPVHRIVAMGVVYIAEERHLFPQMTVYENLILGAYSFNAKKKMRENLEYVFSLFPWLDERKSQLCSSLSGGESRMLAIARGLMGNPSLLLVDEPSAGLSPLVKQSVFAALRKINQERKVTILIVEQEIGDTLALSQRVYLVKNGQIVFEGRAQALQVKDVEEAYF